MKGVMGHKTVLLGKRKALIKHMFGYKEGGRGLGTRKEDGI